MIPHDATEKIRRVNKTKIDTVPSDCTIAIGLLENIQASSAKVGKLLGIKALETGDLNNYRREVYGGADGT